MGGAVVCVNLTQIGTNENDVSGQNHPQLHPQWDALPCLSRASSIMSTPSYRIPESPLTTSISLPLFQKNDVSDEKAPASLKSSLIRTQKRR